MKELSVLEREKDLISRGISPFGRLKCGRRSWTSAAEREWWAAAEERRMRESSATAMEWCTFGFGEEAIAMDGERERDDELT